jgi:hypothetical protein
MNRGKHGYKLDKELVNFIKNDPRYTYELSRENGHRLSKYFKDTDCSVYAYCLKNHDNSISLCIIATAASIAGFIIGNFFFFYLTFVLSLIIVSSIVALGRARRNAYRKFEQALSSMLTELADLPKHSSRIMVLNPGTTVNNEVLAGTSSNFVVDKETLGMSGLDIDPRVAMAILEDQNLEFHADDVIGPVTIRFSQ